MKQAIVIGAGIGGMAAAVRLAVKGYSVTVFEAAPSAGGKLSEIRIGEYRFDAGPSLCTLPEWIDELFQYAGKNPRDYWNYRKPERGCVYFFPDQSRFNAWSDRSRFIQQAKESFSTEEKAIGQYLDQSRRLFEGPAHLFLRKSLHKISTWTNRKAISALLSSPLQLLITSLHSHNVKRLKHPKLVQLFDRYATYNGSDPYQTPGMFSVIPHLEYNIGTCAPEGGMYAITLAVLKLCEELNVKFHFSEKVNRIQIEGAIATGVETGKGFYPADIVVSNMDIARSYKWLMPEQKAPEKILGAERSSSGIVFYWGMNSSFPDLDLHNIFFSSDYEKEFRQIFRDKTIPDDPTVYVNITSKYDKQDAPEGKENWFVMVNVPAGENLPLESWRKEIRKKILKKLSTALGRNIEECIEVEDYLDPERIDSKTISWQGALYGMSSNSPFSAFLRHPNFHSRIKNLYFTGGTVHPGGGIPLCLSSAKIACDMIPKA